MDRSPMAELVRGERLPRRRGDGPWIPRPALGAPRAPPQARGWTGRPPERRAGAHGSPAGAGMDPSPYSTRPAPCGLPRRRGDGPHQNQPSPSRYRAPPQARGWTVRWHPPAALRSGSPAGAGMDRSGSRTRRMGSWLPRRRGDGPLDEEAMLAFGGAPPQARGWTLELVDCPHCHGGSPAGAGMDRRTSVPDAGRRWLPRRRGDGPEISAGDEIRVEAPPQARGWTLCVDLRPEVHPGSPAGAGMDPSVLFGRLDLAGLPRRRGDGPLRLTQQSRYGAAPPVNGG